MPSCAFEKCRNHSRKENKAHGITFHAFPQDESWSYKWVRVVRCQRREPAWTPTNHSRVCSLHFQPKDMYTTEKGRKKIANGAVPSYRLSVDAKPTRSQSTDSETSNTELAPEDRPKEENKFLKRKIERVIANKRKLLIMNKKLKRQNKRLIEKCKSLKGIVSHLKETVSELESKLEQCNINN